MKLDTGTIVAIAAALIFYLRLIVVQRQKVKRMKLVKNQAQTQKGKSGKQARSQARRPIDQQLGFQIVSWYLIGASILLVLLGALIYAVDWFGPGVSPLWWIPFTVGILMLGFSVR